MIDNKQDRRKLETSKQTGQVYLNWTETTQQTQELG